MKHSKLWESTLFVLKQENPTSKNSLNASQRNGELVFHAYQMLDELVPQQHRRGIISATVHAEKPRLREVR